MSQYSQMIGSFIRTGDYPMEANYIFPTEEALKEFYSDSSNATTLHKGLLRVVEDDGDGKQALYWVVPSGDSLEFVKLIENLDIDNAEAQLEELITKLDTEIQDREEADVKIYGVDDYSTLPEDLNSLNDLLLALTALKEDVAKKYEESTAKNTELTTLLKATVGTDLDDIVTYLATLPYESLTVIANALNHFLTETDETETIDTWPELLKFLEGYKDADTLLNILTDLYNKILGTTPSELFSTLRGIEDFVRVLKVTLESVDTNLQTELDLTQVGVGLSGDGSYSADKETYYLQDATSVMNALKILDSLVHEAIEREDVVVDVESNDIIPLTVREDLNKYIISAKLLLSNVLGNELIKKEDGLYLSFNSEYDDGVLTLKINDKIVGQHILGLSSVVSDAYYDSTSEEIVIIFKLLDETTQTVRIPVGSLIREWEPDNSTGAVELTRTEVTNGTDKLSADVRLSSNKHNILEKDGQTLLVSGISSNITHNDTTLDVVLSNLDASVELNTSDITAEISRATTKETELTNSIAQEEIRATKSEENIQNLIDSVSEHINTVESNLTNEISRATATETTLSTNLISETERAKTAEQTNTDAITALSAELDTKAPIDSPIFTGIPQVEVSPDAEDSSLRIPSTNWVNARIAASLGTVEGYMSDDFIIFYTDAEKTLPVTAETGKLYIDKETNLIYRYAADIAQYVELSKLLLGETADVAYAGDQGKINRDVIISLPETLVVAEDNLEVTKATDKITIGYKYYTKDAETYQYNGPTDNSITIEAVTSTEAGLMSTTDKTNLDALYNTKLSHITHTDSTAGTETFTTDANSVKLNYTCYSNSLYGNSGTSYQEAIPVATSSNAGIITASDKELLDTLDWYEED